MDQSIWTCPLWNYLFYDILCSYALPLLCRSSYTMRLLGCARCGYLHCETRASSCYICLICHARVNMLFYCDKHPLHLRICLLFPLVLTLFWVLFFPILQRGQNDKGQMQRDLLLARWRCFLQNFLLYSTIVYMNAMSHHFSIYTI
jgi:hypothetical protein